VTVGCQLAFTVPEFPLLANIFSGPPPWVVTTPRLANIPCNLAFGKRVQSYGLDRGGGGAIGLPPTVLFPGGTDVRDLTSSTFADVIEVPAGSNRWYQVDTAEPAGLGFANWHVAVAVVKASVNIDPVPYVNLVWPTPDPYLLANYP